MSYCGFAEPNSVPLIVFSNSVITPPGDVHGQLLRVGQPGDDHGAALADHVERAGDHFLFHGAHRDQRLIGHLPPGQLVHLGRGLIRAGERVGRPELQRGFPLERQRVHHHDVLGPGRRGALHRVDPDAADAVDHRGVAGPHAARVVRGGPAGRHAAAHQHRGLQRQPVVHLDQRMLRDRGPLGERAEDAHPADVGAAGVEPGRAVGHDPFQDGLAHVAQVLPPGRAVAAGAAVGDEAAHHVVTGLDLGDAGADLLDDAGALVAADDREPRDQVAVDQVQVGMAEPGGDVPDQHLAVLGRVQVEFHDFERLVRVVQYGCPGLHAFSSLRRVGLRSLINSSQLEAWAGPRQMSSPDPARKAWPAAVLPETACSYRSWTAAPSRTL